MESYYANRSLYVRPYAYTLLYTYIACVEIWCTHIRVCKLQALKVCQICVSAWMITAFDQLFAFGEYITRQACHLSSQFDFQVVCKRINVTMFWSVLNIKYIKSFSSTVFWAWRRLIVNACVIVSFNINTYEHYYIYIIACGCILS